MLHYLRIIPYLMGWMPWFEKFDMYSKIWNIIVLFGGGFAISSSGIFLKFPQQPKTQFRYEILSGD